VKRLLVYRIGTPVHGRLQRKMVLCLAEQQSRFSIVPFNSNEQTFAPWAALSSRTPVLLKNADALLPLDKSKTHSIAVIGPLGDNVPNRLARGYAPIHRDASGGNPGQGGAECPCPLSPDDNNRSASNLAAESDVAIVFVGNNPTCNAPFGRCALPGEGKEAVDRKTIDLDPAQGGDDLQTVIVA
jgi:beta-glucosidase-like glycosyl hydrolase